MNLFKSIAVPGRGYSRSILIHRFFWDLMRKKPETIIRQMQQPHYFTVVLFQFRTEDVFKYDHLCKLKHVFCCLYSDQFVPGYHCK